MSIRTRTAGSLATYLELPPPQSSTLLTGTLECSVNWLITRLIISALQDNNVDGGTGVVMVSWVQDEAYWRSQLKLSHGSDVSRMAAPSRFAFIDRLKQAMLPARSSTTEVQDLETAIKQGLDSLSTSKCLVVFDQPDILLSTSPSLEAYQLNELMLKLRNLTQVHSIALAVSSDLPFLHRGDSPTTPLETTLAAFMIQQAHMAHRILSCRPLKTGSARDVSGVLRITAGGASTEVGITAKDLEQRYLVQRDGAVKIVE